MMTGTNGKTLVRAGYLLAASLMISALLPVTGVGTGLAFAEESERPQQKTRRIPSMSEAVFKKLAEAQELVDAKQTDAAMKVLQDMLGNAKRYNGNEIGQIHNMLGYLYFQKENYAAAIREYKQVVAQGEDIPEGLEVTTLYTLAQLSFVEEKFNDALSYMRQWLAKAQNPGPDPHIFMGQVYYQMKDYGQAITQIEKGIAIAKERNTDVKENWWALLNYLYYEKENWPKVLEILEILVRDFPKRDYWVRLAGIYGQEGQEKKQLWTMEAAHAAGFFETEGDYNNLGGLLMQAEVPYRAAKVLEEGLKNKTMKRDTKNLRSLGQALQLAQEVDKAIPVFEEAAKSADDGKLYERLAHLYLEDDQYDKCITAASRALDKGGLSKPQSTYIVRGMCQYNKDQLTSARTSFGSCRDTARQKKDESNERICSQWITYIDREEARRKQLAAAI